MTATDYLETATLNHIFRTDTFTKPTSVWIALHSAAPDEDGSPTNELSGSGYARVEVPCLDANWNAPADDGGPMKVTNVAAVTFPAASADWTAATHFSACDASSAGNVLISGALDVSKTVLNGETARFPAGSLKFTCG